MTAIFRDMAGREGSFVFHPYPVTPLHGDYLYHADFALAARTRFRDYQDDTPYFRIKPADALTQTLVHPEWVTADSDWDAEIIAVDALELMRAQMSGVNGWVAPSYVRNGWFHAELLLFEALDEKRPQLLERAEARKRLEPASRLNATPAERSGGIEASTLAPGPGASHPALPAPPSRVPPAP